MFASKIMQLSMVSKIMQLMMVIMIRKQMRQFKISLPEIAMKIYWEGGGVGVGVWLLCFVG